MTKKDLEIKNKELIETIDGLNNTIETLNKLLEKNNNNKVYKSIITENKKKNK